MYSYIETLLHRKRIAIQNIILLTFAMLLFALSTIPAVGVVEIILLGIAILFGLTALVCFLFVLYYNKLLKKMIDEYKQWEENYKAMEEQWKCENFDPEDSIWYGE